MLGMEGTSMMCIYYQREIEIMNMCCEGSSFNVISASTRIYATVYCLWEVLLDG